MGHQDESPRHVAHTPSAEPGAQHQHEVEVLEDAVFHETTQHAPKHHPQKTQAVPPAARSVQRRFPR